ncbi:hypothetical protein ACJ41O_013106 [Fusarium nematophilum]
MRRVIKSFRMPKAKHYEQQTAQQTPSEPATEAPPIQVSYELPAAPPTRDAERLRFPAYHVPGALPTRAPEPPPRPLTPSADRRCWRDEVRASPLSNFVTKGQGLLRQHDVDQLRSATERYLTSWESYHAVQGSDRDGVLLDLIAGWDRDRDKVMATLACVSFLSAAEASNQLAFLIHLDPATYLRCLAVAGKSGTSLIRDDEREAIERIQPHSYISIECVERFLNAFITCRPSKFLPDQLVLDWLRTHGIIDRLNAEVVAHWECQRLHSAFRLVQCIGIIHSLPCGPDTCSDWKESFWQAWLSWVPNAERLLQWESGCLTDAQNHELSTLIALDGPDTATWRKSCLRLSEPACFTHAQVEPQTTARLEQMLTLLSRSERIGTNTVDLFIYLLVENPAAQSSLEFFEHALDQGGSDEAYGGVVNILRPRSNSLDICTQMTGLVDLLPLLSLEALPNLPNGIGNLATRIVHVMGAAQRELIAQLDAGPGDYVGMSLLAFGKAILASKAIHSSLTPDFLAMVRKFPERDVAESIFERLEEASLKKSGHFSALKSYLVSSLGGCTGLEAGDVDQSDIRDEVEFWKSHPDADRRDLATILASVKHLDYKTYVSCLGSIIYEKDLFVKELRVKLMDEHWGACASLISYVCLRRRHGQLLAHSWTLLVFAFIEERGSLLTRGMARLKTIDQWLGFIQDLLQFTAPATQAQLRPSGDGITRQRLTWWQTLSGYAKALRSIETIVNGFEDVEWIFLTGQESALLTLIEHAQRGKGMPNISRLVVSQLKPNGGNLALVSEMLNSLTRLSRHGGAILEKILTRATGGPAQPRWTDLSLSVVSEAWLDSSLPTSFDKRFLGMMRQNFNPITPFTPNTALSLLGQLVCEHSSLVERARQLEVSRWKLKREDAEEHSRLLHDAGIRDTLVRAAWEGIPAELADAVEEVASNEYELSFPLTGLNELQRQARGVPDAARLLVVRVCLNATAGFCIHYSPNDEATTDRHQYWPKSSGDPDRPVCGTKPSLFTYYLARNLHRLLENPQTVSKRKPLPQVKIPHPLSTIHSNIEKWVTTSPLTCVVCGALLSTKLWKAAACSRPCSLLFRQAPLEARLHNLLVDPLSVDLLISSVYAAALDPCHVDLIPGCPVARAALPRVINSLPSMATLSKAPNLSQVFQRSPNGAEQETLLSWLCLAFRGFLRSVPKGYMIPSMPQTQQFLLMNCNHEREKAFEAHLSTSAGSGPVFHGTSISRLFLILSAGLKNVSNTPFMLNGATAGPGIYCGDEQATSWEFSQAIGSSWSNSAIPQQMRVMLGCELAKYPTTNTPTHVVQDESRVLVRYVFLLPENYHAPPRRHVVPAMSTAFAMLRSGRAT